MKQILQKQSPNKLKDQPSPWLDEYQDCFSLKMKPITQTFIERFSTDLVKWAMNNNEALIISQFYLSKGISPQTFYRWVNKYDIIKEANEIAKQCIGNRREIGALKRKYSESMVMQRQSAYDPEWEADRLRKNKDKIDTAIAIKRAEEPAREKNLTVVMSCFANHVDKNEHCESISHKISSK